MSAVHRLDDYALYDYAIHCALSVLVHNAERFGRGWYHFTDSEMIIAAEILL